MPIISVFRRQKEKRGEDKEVINMKYIKTLNQFSFHLIILLSVFGMVCITGCCEDCEGDEVELSVNSLSFSMRLGFANELLTIPAKGDFSTHKTIIT